MCLKNVRWNSHFTTTHVESINMRWLDQQPKPEVQSGQLAKLQ